MVSVAKPNIMACLAVMPSYKQKPWPAPLFVVLEKMDTLKSEIHHDSDDVDMLECTTICDRDCLAVDTKRERLALPSEEETKLSTLSVRTPDADVEVFAFRCSL